VGMWGIVQKAQNELKAIHYTLPSRQNVCVCGGVGGGN
jgi:hypothetical protein